MAVYSVQDTSLTAIAERIRSKLGLSRALDLEQMATCILPMSYDGASKLVLPSDNVYGVVGDTVTFRAGVLGASSWQWQYGSDGATFYDLPTTSPYETSNTETLSFVANSDAVNWYFRCKVTGNDGTVMYTNVVRIIPPDSGIAIISQPKDVEAAIDEPVTFAVEATGIASYQWQVNSNNGYTWNNLTWGGYATPTMTRALNVNNIQYWYRCRMVTNDGSLLFTNTKQIYRIEQEA